MLYTCAPNSVRSIWYFWDALIEWIKMNFPCGFVEQKAVIYYGIDTSELYTSFTRLSEVWLH